MIDLDTTALDQPQVDLAAALLRSGSIVRLRALGTSMLPALWPGDLLTIDPVPLGAVCVGDIVLCMRNGRFVIHRLRQVGGMSGAADWITQGDAVPNADPAVSAEAILGRVSSVTRGGRGLVPRQPTASDRMFAWISCRSALLCKLVLRLHWFRREIRGQHRLPTGQSRLLPSQTAQ